MDIKSLIEQEVRAQRDLLLMFNHFDQEFASLLDDLKDTAREGVLHVIFNVADRNMFRFKQFTVLNLLRKQREMLMKVRQLCNSHLDMTNKSSVFEMDIFLTESDELDSDDLSVGESSHIFRPLACHVSDTDESLMSNDSGESCVTSSQVRTMDQKEMDSGHSETSSDSACLEYGQRISSDSDTTSVDSSEAFLKCFSSTFNK